MCVRSCQGDIAALALRYTAEKVDHVHIIRGFKGKPSTSTVPEEQGGCHADFHVGQMYP